MKPVIQTYSGIMFDLADPKPHMVTMVDVAHSLARTCRYSGHTTGFYSVAQHSILVAEIVKIIWNLWHLKIGSDWRAQTDPMTAVPVRAPAKILRQALLHDAHEAYIGDVTTPLKNLLGEQFREVEHKIWVAVADALQIDSEIHPVVKIADMAALHVERRCVLTPSYVPWFYESSPKFALLELDKRLDHLTVCEEKIEFVESDFLKELLALR